VDYISSTSTESISYHNEGFEVDSLGADGTYSSAGREYHFTETMDEGNTFTLGTSLSDSYVASATDIDTAGRLKSGVNWSGPGGDGYSYTIEELRFHAFNDGGTQMQNGGSGGGTIYTPVERVDHEHAFAAASVTAAGRRRR